MNSVLEDIMRRSLRFEYLSGGVTPIRDPHSTGWRRLPCLSLAQTRRGRTAVHLEDGTDIPVQTGQLIVLPAGLSHKIDLVTPTGQSNWVHVNYYVLDRLDLFALSTIPPVNSRRLGQAVGDLIARWEKYRARPAANRMAALASEHAFGFELLQLLSEVIELEQGALEVLARLDGIKPLIDYMHLHMREPMDRNTMCQIASVSAASLHRTFRVCTGSTPAGYLRRLRLRHAQRLLMTTNRSVSDIAAEVGYDDQFVFSRFFKRECGMNPSHFRASARNAPS